MYHINNYTIFMVLKNTNYITDLKNKVMVRFKNIEISISHYSLAGHYVLKTTYRGKDINIVFTNSETYDWYNDDSEPENQIDALNYCYRLIVDEYNKLISKK